VASASFPGPLIRGVKVRHFFFQGSVANLIFWQQGDHFLINVIDGLTDDTMLRSTTVVCRATIAR
jgi:hypothetical protein